MESSPNYYQILESNKSYLLPAIEKLLVAHNTLSVPAGGFVDIITRHEHVMPFIDDMTNLGVAIEVISLWCDCIAENRVKYGCPHGYGGPQHESGWYSEMAHLDPFDVKDHGIDLRVTAVAHQELVHWCNTLAKEYCLVGMKQVQDYSPCLVPAFWLALPANW